MSNTKTKQKTLHEQIVYDLHEIADTLCNAKGETNSTEVALVYLNRLVVDFVPDSVLTYEALEGMKQEARSVLRNTIKSDDLNRHSPQAEMFGGKELQPRYSVRRQVAGEGVQFYVDRDKLKTKERRKIANKIREACHNGLIHADALDHETDELIRKKLIEPD